MIENERRIVWVFYIIINTVTVYLNLSLIIAILRLKRRTSTDILIGGLASGVCFSALGCGPQCLINVINGAFTSGKEACFTESFLHLVGMEIQFLSVAAIAYRTFYGIVKLRTFSARKAFITVTIIWLLSAIVTGALSSISPYYLVADETFCFYDWRSPVLMYWAWPLALLCLLLMGYWYYRTWAALKQTGDATVHVTTELDIRGMEKGLAFRLLFLILMFLVGYAGVVWQSIYEFTIGHVPVWGDMITWTIVLFYWLTVALAYAYANPTLSITAVLRCKARGQGGSQQEIEMPSPYGGPRPSVGIQIKPYVAFRTPNESEDWDLGLDMTRSGYRKRSEDEGEDKDDLDVPLASDAHGTPPQHSQGSPSLSALPPIPTYEELHSYSPTSKSKNSSPLRDNYTLITPNNKKNSPKEHDSKQMSLKPLRIPSFSLEDGMLPNFDSSQSANRNLDLISPPSPSQTHGNSSPFHALKPPSPLHHLSPPSNHQTHSSDSEEGEDDEIDPIMAQTRRKEQQQQNDKNNGNDTEVPTVTAVLYTISEEPTPKPTPGSSGRGQMKPKSFFNQNNS